MAAFGDLLRALRAAAGLTQEELAEHAGLSGEAVRSLERGRRRRPRGTTVARLADALAVSPADREALLAAARRQRSPQARDATGGRHQDRLPVAPTALVGRQAELALAADLL